MAEGTMIDPAYVGQLMNALHHGLPGAHIAHEQVRRDRYRFVIIWDRFNDMGHPERQRMVWDIADGVLLKPDLLNVSMIITLGTSEVAN